MSRPEKPTRDGALSPNTVLVFEGPDEFEAIAALLRQLNCTALLGDPAAIGDIAPVAMIRAVLVGDSVPDPVALCAALPPHLPKVLILSDAPFDLRCAAARAGVEAVLKRPINVNELSDWLDHFESRRSVDPVSVLLVDDDALTAELHAAVLRRSGMSVKIVTEPMKALAAIEEVSPDLILMDVEMPDVDGIDLARVIRQSREYLSIPIAFLSAESNERRRMAARECGGDDFIRKPVDLTRLAGLVRLRAERARSMRSLIERDSLTGLLNHGRFKERASIEWERSRRTGSIFSLVMLDIDHFKDVNDRFGHPVGDNVIRALARMLAGRLRAVDVIGRYGGEEFAVLLVDTAPKAARDTMDKVRKLFGELQFEEPDGRFSVTFSAGIASAFVDGVPRLFAAADDALYLAKRAGRNRIEIASDDPSLSTRRCRRHTD